MAVVDGEGRGQGLHAHVTRQATAQQLAGMPASTWCGHVSPTVPPTAVVWACLTVRLGLLPRAAMPRPLLRCLDLSHLDSHVHGRHVEGLEHDLRGAKKKLVWSKGGALEVGGFAGNGRSVTCAKKPTPAPGSSSRGWPWGSGGPQSAARGAPAEAGARGGKGSSATRAGGEDVRDMCACQIPTSGATRSSLKKVWCQIFSMSSQLVTIPCSMG